MFCRHHFNPQGLRGLKVWEVSHACSNTEWQAPLMPGSSLALTTASLQILHMPLWDLMCHEGLWTGNWQALNGKFPQSWGVHQLWRLETLLCLAGPFRFCAMQTLATPRISFICSLNSICLLGRKVAVFIWTEPQLWPPSASRRGQIKDKWGDNGSEGGSSTEQTPKPVAESGWPVS